MADASASGATVPTPSADPSTAGQPPTTSPAGTPPASPPSPAPGAPASGAPPASATARASEEWTPPDRKTWEGVENARRAAIARAAALDRDLKAERLRVQALAGVTPKNPEEAQRQELADAFFENFPQFRMFRDPKIGERLAQLLERGDDIAQASDHVWDGLTRRTLDIVIEKYADETGIDPADLDDEGKRWLASLFFQMAQADPAKFQQRYEREDPTLVTDFMGQLKKRFFDPARRREAQGMVRGQPRVPSSGASRPVVSAPPNINFADPQAVEDAAVEYMRSRGHLQSADT